MNKLEREMFAPFCLTHLKQDAIIAFIPKFNCCIQYNEQGKMIARFIPKPVFQTEPIITRAMDTKLFNNLKSGTVS